MMKKTLFFGIFSLIALVAWKQDSDAKTWENTKVPADSIIAAIERGDSVELYDCEVLEPLIMEGTSVRPDTITSFIRAWGTTFYDTVSFKHCHFMDELDFHDDTLAELVYFDRAIFTGNAIFYHVFFEKRAIFNQLNFNRDVSFSQTTFAGDTDFYNTIFCGTVDFSLTTFDRSADFGLANFLENADFAYIIFDKSVNFEYVVFKQNANFYKTVFGGIAVFKYICFYAGDALFSHTSFKRDADFSQATFGRKIDLSNTTFNGEADFFNSRFCGQVSLSYIEFKNILISWQQLKGHLIFDPSVCFELMKHFEEKRQLDDADGIYLFAKDLERIGKPWYVRYPEYWSIQLTCGYGVKPERVLLVSSLIIVFFAFFYTKSNAIEEIEKESRHSRRRRILRSVRRSFGKRVYDAIYFSVQTFIIGVVPDWHPTDEFLINTRRIRLFKFRTLSMIEGSLGWILLVLFVVTLTRKFIR